MTFTEKITALFPLWLVLIGGIAFYEPSLMAWVSKDLITAGLGVIMLCMGLTLRLSDFLLVFRMPSWVLSGIALQYTLMPLSGWLIATWLQLPDYLSVGVILVACCPGGTASNVITYLAKGQVALSVTMTAISTMLAVICTPLLTSLLAGNTVDVPAGGLIISTIKVVLLPVIFGLLINQYLPGLSKRVTPFAPPFAVIVITLIVAGIVSGGKKHLITAGWSLLLAVSLLHAIGFLLGGVMAWLFFRRSDVARTIAIEVGMQNSGLGVVLAKENFLHPATAIPAALSSLVHSMIGSLLAFIWRKR